MSPKVKSPQETPHCSWSLHATSSSIPQCQAAMGKTSGALSDHTFEQACIWIETWTFASQRSREHFHAGVLRLYRRLYGGAHDAHLRDEDLLQHTGLLTPGELLRRARLRYVGTLYRAGDSICWGLINRDQEWLSLLRFDLEWSWAQLESTTPYGHPADHFAAWEEVIKYYPGYWKRPITWAIKHAALQQMLWHTFIKTSSDIWSKLGSCLLNAQSHLPNLRRPLVV